MIDLKHASKTYHMGSVEVKALRDVSVSIAAGEFVAIMGPSGSGKSTLMHVLGLLDRPDEGKYWLGKKNIASLSEVELSAVRNRLVGFVFQQFHLLPRMNALENAELPLIYAGRRDLRKRAEEMIREVRLEDRLRHRPGELSGGQQQRVAIARSLVNDPVIIMADEPTGNLDSKSQEEILALLEGLNRQGKTIIIVTHEKEIAEHAPRIIHMRDGRIISDERLAAPRTAPAESRTDEIIDTVLSRSERAMRQTKLLDYAHQAGIAMLSHKMRSALSILGILIGVAAVIAMLAIGQGAKKSIETRLASLGSNLLMVHPGSPRHGPVHMEAGSATRFTMQDAQAIGELSDLVARISPSVTGRGQLVYGNKNWNTQIEGVGVAYASLRASEPEIGRFFTEGDVKIREKVVLLGPTVAKELFGDKNPVGETIKINLLNFRVIGVLPSKGAAGWHDQDDVALIPVSTAMYRVFGKDYLDSIYVEARSADVIEQAQEAIKDLVRKRHRLDREDEDTFDVRNMADIRATLEATTKTMSLLLGSIAAISLLVGGIGIMNIMLVSVTERTREIGLRKAIGANNKDIMLQFIIESVLMALIGGGSGVLFGIGAAMLITFFAKWTVSISAASIVLATAFSFFVGIVFGLWPAQKAARLDPIDALRYE